MTTITYDLIIPDSNVQFLYTYISRKLKEPSSQIDVHCKEISIYVFPEKGLRGISPNFHIRVSVSDLYIPTIGPPIFLQLQNRQTDFGIYKSLTETWM